MNVWWLEQGFEEDKQMRCLGVPSSNSKIKIKYATVWMQKA